MDVYRGNSVFLSVKATDNSYRDFTLMGDDVFVLDFYNETELALQIGDYVYAFGQRFSIVEESVPVLEKGVYHYSLKLYGTYKELEKVKAFYADVNGRDLTQSEFSYTCTPAELVLMLVRNLNSVQPDNNWQVGDTLVAEVQTISISSNNCLEILSTAASQWETEYWVDGFTVHLTKRQVDNGQSFRETTGLLTVATEKNANQRAVNRVYAFGGTRNLPENYGSARLRLPGIKYVGDATATDIVEDVQTFDDIYPRRTGTISAVRVDANGIYYFSDAGLPFNPNDYQIAGLAKHVIFQGGKLIGLDFEVNYNEGTFEFELIQYQESDGQTLPADPLIPAVGDTYIIYNISMPQTYVDAAEAELQTAAQAYYDANKNDKLSFNITFDEVYFTAHDLSIAPGEMVTIEHSLIDVLKQGLNIRITAFKQYHNKQNKFDGVKVSDTVYVNPVSSVTNKVTKIETQLKKAGISLPRYAAKNWRDLAEIVTMVKSVQTELLLVGNKQGQFTIEGVTFTPNADGIPDHFSATAGVLIHRTIPEDNPGTWNMAAAALIMTNETIPYYVYAKCSKANNSGTFVLSTTSVAYDSDASYWWFLIGVVSSLNSNHRSWQTVYGFSEISGNEVTTGVIRSTDGNTYFDLVDSIIQGNIKFVGGGDVETAVSSAQSDATTGINNAAAAQASANDAATAASNAQTSANNAATAASNAQSTADAKQDAAINGVTLINGGLIRTQFLDAAQILLNSSVNGQTFIDGGKINTNLINAYQLVSRILKTADTGARVEINGVSQSIVIFDASNNPKIVMSPKAIMSESDIATTGTITTTYAARSVSLTSVGSATMDDPETLVINDNKNYNLTTPEISCQLNARASYGNFQSASIAISIVETVSGNEHVLFTHSVYSNSVNKIIHPQSYLGTFAAQLISGISNGTYKMKVVVTLSGSGIGSASASIASGQTMVAQTMVSYTEIGVDGMNIINTATDYFHISSGKFSVKKMNPDLPGVLASASVDSSGSSSNKFGAKVGNSSKTNTGTYSIAHTIGNSTYKVNIAAASAARVCYYTFKGNTSITIITTNLSGTPIDTAFDYTLVGNNN